VGDSAAAHSAGGDSAGEDSSADDSAAGDSAAGDSAAGDSSAEDSAAGNDSAAGDSAAGDSGAAVQDGAMSALDGSTEPQPDASLDHCAPPPDLACDPVSGEGCLLFMQCLADPSSSAPAAYCVLSGIQLLETCEQGVLSTDCPPRHTCVMGQCRQYCYCDADCDHGAACGEPSSEGSARFRLCEQTSAP
jgi:hypothetical protein